MGGEAEGLLVQRRDATHSKGKIPPLTQEHVDNLVAYTDSLKSEVQKLNDAAMGAFDEWVPKLFLKRRRRRTGGYRVGSTRTRARSGWRTSRFTRTGIKDFGEHDMATMSAGIREAHTKVDVVMEWQFEVPIEELGEGEHTEKFDKAVAWLREALGWPLVPADDDASSD